MGSAVSNPHTLHQLALPCTGRGYLTKSEVTSLDSSDKHPSCTALLAFPAQVRLLGSWSRSSEKKGGASAHFQAIPRAALVTPSTLMCRTIISATPQLPLPRSTTCAVLTLAIRTASRRQRGNVQMAKMYPWCVAHDISSQANLEAH